MFLLDIVQDEGEWSEHLAAPMTTADIRNIHHKICDRCFPKNNPKQCYPLMACKYNGITLDISS